MLHKTSGRTRQDGHRFSPYLLGALMGLLLLGFVAVQEMLFPQLGPTPGQQNSVNRDAFFSVFFFGILVASFWRQRKRVSLWVSMSILFGFHVLGLAIYDTYVEPLALWQWDFVILAEFAIVIFCLDWSVKRLERFYKRNHA